MKKTLLALALCGVIPQSYASNAQQAVIEHYADTAYAVYQDALLSAKQLHRTLEALVQTPTEHSLASARAAWRHARIPYQQSEVFRFGNPVVDDWEGQLNAWPLDEGLIDYVNTQHYEYEMGNVGAKANLIASTELILGNQTIDLRQLTPELLADLNEIGGSEANVATGYHAIEFLLWGQDLNGYQQGSGQRPHTDFIQGPGCTHDNCQRRGDYLLAASELLISDLNYMVKQWASEQQGNYRAEFIALQPEEALRRMLYGMGSLSLGELAGERMKVALEANSPEDEHDCFSDNTHNSHFYNAQGIVNVATGRYQRLSGEWLTGPSLLDLYQTQDQAGAKEFSQSLNATMARLQVLVDSANAGQPFDHLIAPNNTQGNAIVRDAIQSLVQQTRHIVSLSSAIGIASLDPDTADHHF